MTSEIKYSPNHGGIILNILFIALYIAISVASIIQGLHEVAITNMLINGKTFAMDIMTDMLARRHLLANFTIISYITCRSLFLNWAYYAQRNLKAFQIEGLKFDTWRLIIGFIIPIFNFYLPIVLINEIWQASNPHHQQTKTSKMIICWWLLNLAWIFLSIFNTVAKVSAFHLETIRRIYLSTILSDVMGICVMLWTLYILLTIYKRQQQKLKVLNG